MQRLRRRFTLALVSDSPFAKDRLESEVKPVTAGIGQNDVRVGRLVEKPQGDGMVIDSRRTRTRKYRATGQKTEQREHNEPIERRNICATEIAGPV